MISLLLRGRGLRLNEVEGHLGDYRDGLVPERGIELMPPLGGVSFRWKTRGRDRQNSTSLITTGAQGLPLRSGRRTAREGL
jgi:hypothetical protein